MAGSTDRPTDLTDGSDGKARRIFMMCKPRRLGRRKIAGLGLGMLAIYLFTYTRVQNGAGALGVRVCVKLANKKWWELTLPRL